jgi:hypothetical protein
MTLTGKCKEDFDNWREKINHIEGSNLFYATSKSMQHGVYEDFFDSVGVRVFIEEEYDKMLGYQRGFNPLVNGVQYYQANDCFINRQEARERAIEKANEIYNEK